MTPTDRHYWMLVASLPRLERPWRQPAPSAAPALPIGRERLRSRLGLLHAGDASALQAAWAALDRLETGRVADDAEAGTLAAATLALPLPAPCTAWIGNRLAEHGAVALLRRRRMGLPPPPSWHWPMAPDPKLLTRRYGDPDLGLGVRWPWLQRARLALDAGDLRALQTLVDERAWRAAQALRAAAPFAFSAVFAWCMQWRVAARWDAATPERAALQLRAMLPAPAASARADA